jgi:hypothetical protein
MFEMLTGEPPFTAGSIKELLHVIVHDPVAIPSKIHAQYPLAEDAIIKLLQKDPTQRLGHTAAAATAAATATGGGEGELGVEVRKTPLLRHFCIKIRPFDQDRLGTNIGKALKKRVMAALFVHFCSQEIKRHPFFEGIDWEKLLAKDPSIVPPFKPASSKSNPLLHFDKKMTAMKMTAVSMNMNLNAGGGGDPTTGSRLAVTQSRDPFADFGYDGVPAPESEPEPEPEPAVADMDGGAESTSFTAGAQATGAGEAGEGAGAEGDSIDRSSHPIGEPAAIAPPPILDSSEVGVPPPAPGGGSDAPMLTAVI